MKQALVLLAAMLAATIPMWFVRIPPLIDLPGHMGRYHVQLNLAHSPLLQAHWAYEWRLIGNLGIDLLMEPLGRTLGIERASWLVAALLPPLMIWGIVRLARAWHGSVPPTVVAAFPFALSYPWQYGLVNFWLAAALALHAAASAIRRPRTFASPVALAGLSLALWTCHIYGWAIFAILVWSHAIASKPSEWPRRMLACLPLAAPILVMLALSYGQHDGAATLGWWRWQHKWGSLLYTLRDQHRLLDLFSLALCLVPFAAALFPWSRLRIAPAGAIAAAAVLLAVVILPYQLLGSAWADARLWPLAFISATIAVSSGQDASVLWQRWVPALLLALFGARLIVGAIGFAEYDRAYKRHLTALDRVEAGSRIATLARYPCAAQVPWRRPRIEHLDGIAILRRDAFTNGQWDVPGGETIVPLAARGTRYSADPSELVRARDCPDDLRPQLAASIARLPRDRFDYVWVLDFDPASLPRYRELEPVYTDDRTALYRIQKP
jgi:hypothetical protein